MTLDADLAKLTADELQLRLSQHALERPSMTDPAFTGWSEIKDALKFHLDLKRGEERVAWKDNATGAAAPPPPRHTFGRTQPIPATPEPAAQAAPESPMPLSAPQISPEDRLSQLLARLAANAKSGTPTAASLTRGAIRRHCEEHGLPVPKEAQIRRDCAPKQFRKSAAKTRATAPKASASPQGKRVSPGQGGSKGRVIEGAVRRSTLGPGAQAPTLHPPALVVFDAGASPVDQLRHIRLLALSVLPDLDDLSLEVAAQAHDEMALLKKVLVLGEDLIVRRTA